MTNMEIKDLVLSLNKRWGVRWDVESTIFDRIRELEGALERIGSDRSMNRADCAAYAGEVLTGNFHVYSSPIADDDL